jgi:hypothetical protein
MAPRPPAEHWTLDKRIPIALMGFMLVQFGTAVWFFSDLNGRMSGAERAIESGVEIDRDQNRTDASILDRTTRLETDYLGSKTEVSRRLDMIDNKLDRLLETWRSPTRSEFAPANRAP